MPTTGAMAAAIHRASKALRAAANEKLTWAVQQSPAHCLDLALRPLDLFCAATKVPQSSGTGHYLLNYVLPTISRTWALPPQESRMRVEHLHRTAQWAAPLRVNMRRESAMMPAREGGVCVGCQWWESAAAVGLEELIDVGRPSRHQAFLLAAATEAFWEPVENERPPLSLELSRLYLLDAGDALPTQLGPGSLSEQDKATLLVILPWRHIGGEVIVTPPRDCDCDDPTVGEVVFDNFDDMEATCIMLAAGSSYRVAPVLAGTSAILEYKAVCRVERRGYWPWRHLEGMNANYYRRTGAPAASEAPCQWLGCSVGSSAIQISLTKNMPRGFPPVEQWWSRHPFERHEERCRDRLLAALKFAAVQYGAENAAILLSDCYTEEPADLPQADNPGAVLRDVDAALWKVLASSHLEIDLVPVLLQTCEFVDSEGELIEMHVAAVPVHQSGRTFDGTDPTRTHATMRVGCVGRYGDGVAHTVLVAPKFASAMLLMKRDNGAKGIDDEAEKVPAESWHYGVCVFVKGVRFHRG